MNLQLELSNKARDDLARQYGWYLKQADPDVAERYLLAFQKTAAKLTAAPGLGRLRRFRSPKLANIRSFVMEMPFSIHLIFYRVNRERLIIVRVIHGARDLPRQMTQ